MNKPKPWRALYNSAAWRQLRAVQLLKQPKCVICWRQGRITEARVVDHIKAHRGEPSLFFDPFNLQSLCKHCHDSAKQRQEKSGTLSGCDASGMPIDPAHHWLN